MSGYDGYSKSNNALNAEARGLMTATVLGKVLKVKAAVIKANLTRMEWHHTSSRYKVTDYYDEPLLVALATDSNLEDWDGDEIVEAVKQLEEMRAVSKRKVIPIEYRARVTWLEWTGTRKCPMPTECVGDATVIEKGHTFTITLDSGEVIIKRRGTNGFSISKIEN